MDGLRGVPGERGSNGDPGVTGERGNDGLPGRPGVQGTPVCRKLIRTLFVCSCAIFFKKRRHEVIEVSNAIMKRLFADIFLLA